MSLNPLNIESLIVKLMDGTISDQELYFLNQWINSKMNKDSYQYLDDKFKNKWELKEKMQSEILKKITNENQRQPIKTHALSLIKFAAAILILAFGIYLVKINNVSRNYLKNNQELSFNPDTVFANTGQATLKLSNGQIINLNNNQTKIQVSENAITYGDSKTEILDINNELIKEEVFSLSTPPSTTYQIILPDGSTVWLNGKSVLTYPNKFIGNTRQVKLDGEAYFAIKHKNKQPFIVETLDQTVEVLGTEFNINNYAENTYTTTTLIKGSIKLIRSGTGKNESRVLKPGEQASLSSTRLNVKYVDTEQFISWKEGFFYFDGLDPKVAIEQMASWYDIDIEFGNNIPNANFFGTINRNKSLGFALNLLKKSGLKYKVFVDNGRKKLQILN